MLIAGHRRVSSCLLMLALGRVQHNGRHLALELQHWDMSTLHSSGQLTFLLQVHTDAWYSGSRYLLLLTPLLSKQTLPLKVFLVTVVAVFGFTLSADNALLKFETRQRIEEAAVRKEARMELAKRGLVPTETEIAKWREANGK